MKQTKAVVIGGSNGIGLALGKELRKQGYELVILDREAPAFALERGVTYHRCVVDQMSREDEDLLEALAKDPSVNVLFLTVGLGRIAPFEALGNAEIEQILRVNTEATIKILSVFYARLQAKESFYCGLLSSIAGLVSSPLFAVYAASKAALCRFAESVNIELEKAGTDNRILNVAPGKIDGTRFYGARENNLEVMEPIAKEILGQLWNRETLYIPAYEPVYRSVLERYQKDSHQFGLESYDYKKSSGRMSAQRRIVVGYLSGTFDMFHQGHLNLLKRAREQCDVLIVGVHTDATHKNKTVLVPLEERMAVVQAIRYVDRVVRASGEDSTDWETLHFDRLFVGSDYKGSERFAKYEQFFKEKDVEIVYFPYTEGVSSSLRRAEIQSLAGEEEQ